MSNPSLAFPEVSRANPHLIEASPDRDDDDDDDADWDDDDEDLTIAQPQGWFAHAGFASPEWWCH